MKSFIVKDKKPLIKWGNLPDNTFFEGTVPEGYHLAVSPSKEYIVIDVDVNLEKDKNGFQYIPKELLEELEQTYNYTTKRGGKHFWLNYGNTNNLLNISTALNIDIRLPQKGYAIYYPFNNKDDIRNHISEIKECSNELKKWIDELFS
jgi:hypothetical protein